MMKPLFLLIVILIALNMGLTACVAAIPVPPSTPGLIIFPALQQRLGLFMSDHGDGGVADQFVQKAGVVVVVVGQDQVMYIFQCNASL